MKFSSELEQPAFAFMPEESEEKTKSVTFRPDDDNWDSLQEALEALGPVGKIRGTQTRLVNDAFRAGLPATLKKWGIAQQEGLQEFFERVANRKKKSGKAR